MSKYTQDQKDRITKTLKLVRTTLGQFHTDHFICNELYRLFWSDETKESDFDLSMQYLKSQKPKRNVNAKFYNHKFFIKEKGEEAWWLYEADNEIEFTEAMKEKKNFITHILNKLNAKN